MLQQFSRVRSVMLLCCSCNHDALRTCSCQLSAGVDDIQTVSYTISDMGVLCEGKMRRSQYQTLTQHPIVDPALGCGVLTHVLVLSLCPHFVSLWLQLCVHVYVMA